MSVRKDEIEMRRLTNSLVLGSQSSHSHSLVEYESSGVSGTELKEESYISVLWVELRKVAQGCARLHKVAQPCARER